MTESIKILLVDDNPADVDLIKVALAGIAYQSFDVQVASRLDEALEKLRDNEFDVMLLDLGLPDSPREKTVKSVRAENAHIPIVVLSGVKDVHISVESLDDGAQEYLAKDVVNPSSLGRVIRYAIQRQQLAVALEENHKQAEQKKFKRLLESAPDAMVLVNDEGHILFVNWQAEQLFGYDRRDLLGQSFDILVGALPAKQASMSPSSLPTAAQEQVGVRKDGTHVPVEVRLATVDVDEGTLVSAAIRDISQRKRAEEEIRQLAKLPDETPEPVLRVSGEGKILYANAASHHLLAAAGRRSGRVDDELSEELLQAVREAIESGCKVAIEFTCCDHEFDVAIVPYPDAGYVNLYGRDITHRKRTEAALKDKEKQLYQSQKLEAVGALAGGVAHEFNNLLQVIQGYASFAMQGLPENEASFTDLEQVLKAAGRASVLTRQLLSFGRRHEMCPILIDAGELLDDTAKLLGPLIGEHITLRTVVPEKTDLVYGDPTLLQQMLMNLAVNARDAMPDGGELILATESVLLDDTDCTQHVGTTSGNYVLFSISDNGTGMTPDVQSQIFEPFFTTKEVGDGTGLGLAMVYGVVQEHEGTIQVESEPGRGTTFRIYLPVAEVYPIDAACEDSLPTVGGHETILVAEDEPMVREITVRHLTAAGYSVLTAEDGEQAIRVFENNADAIDLSLLDMVMPKVLGRKVYQTMQSIRPNAKVIFCSGYDADKTCEDLLENNDLRLIHKPFGHDTLLRAVRETLDKGIPCDLGV